MGRLFIQILQWSQLFYMFSWFFQLFPLFLLLLRLHFHNPLLFITCYYYLVFIVLCIFQSFSLILNFSTNFLPKISPTKQIFLINLKQHRPRLTITIWWSLTLIIIYFRISQFTLILILILIIFKSIILLAISMNLKLILFLNL